MRIKSLGIEKNIIEKETGYIITSINEKEISSIDSFFDEDLLSTIGNKSIKPSGKKVGLFFSGGYDSTALLIRNLEAGNEVYPLDIIFNNLTESFIKRINIYLLQTVYGKDLLHSLTTVADCRRVSMGLARGLGVSFETRGYTLQPELAFYSAFIPDYILKEIDEIQFGFAIGDAAISFLDEFNNIYNNSLRFKIYGNEFKIPPLTFPLKQHRHENNISEVDGWCIDNKINLICSSCDQQIQVRIKKSKDEIKYKFSDCFSCPKCKKIENTHNIYTVTLKI